MVFLDALHEFFSSWILGIFFVLILDNPWYYNLANFSKCCFRVLATVHTTVYTNHRRRFFKLVKFDGCRFDSLVYVDFLKYLPQLTHRWVVYEYFLSKLLLDRDIPLVWVRVLLFHAVLIELNFLTESFCLFDLISFWKDLAELVLFYELGDKVKSRVVDHCHVDAFLSGIWVTAVDVQHRWQVEKLQICTVPYI